MEKPDWTKAEKQHARKLFDLALQAELAEILVKYKAKVASIETLEQMWEMSNYLNSKGRYIDEKYEFKYSQLDLLFIRLVQEKRLTLAQLQGIREENWERISSFVENVLS
jgi:hypothetical protein